MIRYYSRFSTRTLDRLQLYMYSVDTLLLRERVVIPHLSAGYCQCFPGIVPYSSQLACKSTRLSCHIKHIFSFSVFHVKTLSTFKYLLTLKLFCNNCIRITHSWTHNFLYWIWTLMHMCYERCKQVRRICRLLIIPSYYFALIGNVFSICVFVSLTALSLD